MSFVLIFIAGLQASPKLHDCPDTQQFLFLFYDGCKCGLYVTGVLRVCVCASVCAVCVRVCACVCVCVPVL